MNLHKLMRAYCIGYCIGILPTIAMHFLLKEYFVCVFYMVVEFFALKTIDNCTWLIENNTDSPEKLSK